MDDAKKHAGLIFMKVGLHAQESIEDIIARKQKEYEHTGSIFWGYGGGACHPLRMVQPFAKEIEERGEQVLIIMQKMDSKHKAPPEVAKEYSDDGVTWKPIPKGIEVRGSRFALVLDELRVEEFEVDLGELTVGIGPSRGKRGDKYLVGQSDKGCFVFSEREIPAPPEERIIKPVSLVARIKSPFAVLVRN
ncbi:MAG: hypothetical protein Q7K57_07220 [Burkholderiaceae bacterium]|nr:hypothetical protein [Burkholderiaceae bacterium]